MEKISSLLVILAFFQFGLAACSNKDNNNNTKVVTQTENSNPVTAVSACHTLTIEKVNSVYPDKKFKVEVDRNDTPNIYEALSACRYQEDLKPDYEKYYVDLEVRAKPSAKDALASLNSSKEMDYDKKGKSLSGYGDDAYYTNQSMAYGGPKIEFVKDNVYYKLTLQTIKQGSFDKLESELIALVKKVLE